MAQSWVLGACVGGVGFVLSIVLTVVVLVRLPKSYFANDDRSSMLPGRPEWQRVTARALKNVAGALLVVLGVVMAVPGVPGQGLLTILIGVVLLDIPGKRAMERRILRVKAVRRAVDNLRRRFGREPFDLETADTETS